MRVYVFTDLDDTLFQTRRKCCPPHLRAVPEGTEATGAGEIAALFAKAAEEGGARSGTSCSAPPRRDPSSGIFPAGASWSEAAYDAADLAVGAVSRSLEPLSFLLPHQQALFGLLDERARIIPVTARNRDAFARVRLPFRHGAVLNYGGTILTPEGVPDPDWTARMRPELAAARPLLEDVLARARAVIAREAPDCAVRMVDDGGGERGGDGRDGPAFYVVAKRRRERPDARPEAGAAGLALLRDALAEAFPPGAGGRLHCNDNNLAFIPDALNKAHAVSHLIETRIRPSGEAYLTVGMGDSLEDLDFMNLCDYSMVPRTSQIAAARLRGARS